MDDPLRQKSVPLAAETVLWFEFLIDPSLLTAYLNRDGNGGGPKPIELINQFLAKPHATHPVSVQSVTTIDATAAASTTAVPATPTTSPPSTPAIGGDNGSAGADPIEAFGNIGRKQLAQKILSLKVASHLRWDLTIFERNLTLQKQVQLLGDLCTVTAGKIVPMPIAPDADLAIGPEGNAAALRFALTLYHRWVLRTQLLKELPARLAKGALATATAAAQMPLQMNDPNMFRGDAFMASLDASIPHSLDYLYQLVTSDDAAVPFVTLTYDTFTAIGGSQPQQSPLQQTTTQHRQTFAAMQPISLAELRTQIYFDLCTFYLHTKKYELARDNALLCRRHLAELHLEYGSRGVDANILADTTTSSPPPPFRFCNVDEAALRGCLLACGCGEPSQMSLMHRLTESQLRAHSGLVEILREDNVRHEIPLVNRRIVELDIEAIANRTPAAATATTAATPATPPKSALLVQVSALNAIRAALDRDDHLFTFGDFMGKYRAHDGLAVLVQNTNVVLPHLDSEQQQRLRRMFAGILLDSRNDVAALADCGLFDREQLAEMGRLQTEPDRSVSPVPVLAVQLDWRVSETKNPRLEAGTLKRQLVACDSPQAVRKLLIKLAATNPSQPLWSVNPSWVLPPTLLSTVMSLQRGFLQDFVYILMGKTKELTDRNDFAAATAMLACLRAECARPDLLANGIVRKLEKQLDWELLQVQHAHMLHAWPRPCYEHSAQVQRCKQVLGLLQHQHGTDSGGNNILPRIEVVMSCATMLLNLGDWTPSNWPEKRYQPLDMCAAFAAAAAEAESFNGGGAKKVCRDAWEMVLPMFLLQNGGGGGGGGGGDGNKQQKQQQQQRGGGGGDGQRGGNGGGGGGGPNGGGSARDSPSLVVGTGLTPFLKRLRGVGIISVVLSLLARLHNLLKDDANMEILAENLSLWPASLSNTSAYSIRAVSETLGHLLKQGLHYHPQHLPWLRLSGDFEFVADNNETAMQHYVTVLLTGTEYCTLHLQQRQLLDDHMTRRMIKASLNLGCNIQAAILCQLLDEMDYALAFKCIAERTTFKNIGDKSAHYCDAMDAYYGCVWDATLLEYIIQQHCRKGEHKRKQQAIALIGQLELNANNNEEIKREAAAIRRTRFLRALAKQYML